MPDLKPSAFTLVADTVDTDTVPLARTGVNNRASLARLSRSIRANSTASQALTAGTAAILTGSILTIPTGVLVTNTSMMQWKIIITKTAAGAVANTLTLRVGTAGTTADPVLLTFTTVIGTANADVARIDILLTVPTAGATGALQGTFAMTKNAGTILGWINIPSQVINATSAAINLNTAGLKFSIAATTGTGIVATVNQVVAEAVSV